MDGSRQGVATTKRMTYMKTITISHVKYSPTNGFEDFTSKLEKQLGQHESSAYQLLLTDPNNKEKVKKILEAQEGSSGLMLFSSYDHGALLNIKNGPHKARQYIIGNPLYASRMTEHDIRAALYAPLRVLVYVDTENAVQVEYDLPSTLFGQFNNAEVDVVAKELDVKLERLIKNAART